MMSNRHENQRNSTNNYRFQRRHNIPPTKLKTQSHRLHHNEGSPTSAHLETMWKRPNPKMSYDSPCHFRFRNILLVLSRPSIARFSFSAKNMTVRRTGNRQCIGQLVQGLTVNYLLSFGSPGGYELYDRSRAPRFDCLLSMVHDSEILRCT